MIVKELAEPRPVGDSVKKAIGRVSIAIGFGWSRTKDLWYGDARRVDAEELDALRLAKKKREAKRRAAQRIDAEVAARAEAALAVERMVALRAALASIDADFHREAIDRLDHALRGMGAEVGAVAVRPHRPEIAEPSTRRGSRPGA